MKFAFADTSGPLRKVVEPLLLELITPESCCQEGIAMESGEMPPPLSAQAVSDFQGPAGTGGDQVGAADGNNIGIVRRPCLI